MSAHYPFWDQVRDALFKGTAYRSEMNRLLLREAQWYAKYHQRLTADQKAGTLASNSTATNPTTTTEPKENTEMSRAVYDVLVAAGAPALPEGQGYTIDYERGHNPSVSLWETVTETVYGSERRIGRRHLAGASGDPLADVPTDLVSAAKYFADLASRAVEIHEQNLRRAAFKSLAGKFVGRHSSDEGSPSSEMSDLLATLRAESVAAAPPTANTEKETEK